jgi:VanZ family protein
MLTEKRINAKAAILKYWLPLIVYCAVIFIQSSFASPDVELGRFHFDKILHVLVYAGLGILFYRAYGTLRIPLNQTVLIILSILSAALYGASDELHQSFVAGRHADLFDLLADVVGSICGVAIYGRFAQLE